MKIKEWKRIKSDALIPWNPLTWSYFDFFLFLFFFFSDFYMKHNESGAADTPPMAALKEKIKLSGLPVRPYVDCDSLADSVFEGERIKTKIYEENFRGEHQPNTKATYSFSDSRKAYLRQMKSSIHNLSSGNTCPSDSFGFLIWRSINLSRFNLSFILTQLEEHFSLCYFSSCFLHLDLSAAIAADFPKHLDPTSLQIEEYAHRKLSLSKSALYVLDESARYYSRLDAFVKVAPSTVWGKRNRREEKKEEKVKRREEKVVESCPYHSIAVYAWRIGEILFFSFDAFVKVAPSPVREKVEETTTT